MRFRLDEVVARVSRECRAKHPHAERTSLADSKWNTFPPDCFTEASKHPPARRPGYGAVDGSSSPWNNSQAAGQSQRQGTRTSISQGQRHWKRDPTCSGNYEQQEHLMLKGYIDLLLSLSTLLCHCCCRQLGGATTGTSTVLCIPQWGIAHFLTRQAASP